MAEEKILIVEDEAIVAMEIETRLRRLGYGIAGVTGSGEAAITMARETKPDLVLMDIMLEGEIDGIGASAEIRMRADIPVVFLTAYADEKTLRRAKLTEPFGYIMKPFEEIELRTTIEVALYKHAMGKKLRESELLFRMLFERAGDAIFILEAEGAGMGRIVDVNKAGAAMHGYAVDELRGMKIWDLNAHDEGQEAAGLIDRILKGEWVKSESEHRRKDGDLFVVEITAGLLELGNRTYILAFDRDITGRRQAEAALRQSYDAQLVISELLRLTLTDSGLTDILARALDLILSLAWLSAEAKGCIFLAEGERGDLVMTVQRNMNEHVYADCARLLHGACLCGRAASTKTIVFAGRNDERHDILHDERDHHGHYCVPILDNEVLLGVINIYLRPGHRRNAKDEEVLTAVANALAGIIKRRKMEEERDRLHRELQETFKKVERSQKEWQETFDSITDLVSIHDEHHTIVKANKAFATHYQLDLRDIVNRKCYELFHHTDAPVLNCPHIRSLARNQPVTEEVRDQKTGQVLLVSTFPYTFPDSEGRGSIHIARDVTSEREKEMRLIMSERLASLGQMASGIAHEINNPLAAIAGCAEGLLNRVRQDRYSPEFFANYLTIINEEIMRCKGITTSMLSIVRQTSYVQKTIDLHEVLEKTLEIIGFQGRLKSVDVVREYHEALPLVHGSEGELKQVFLAIITNALDALEGEGALTIRTEVADDAVLVRISDTGPGIPPEHLQKLFEPFFTTKLDKGGTGLGLSIARKIVDSHGGRIEVSTELSKGTTFTIGLPRLAPDEAPQA